MTPFPLKFVLKVTHPLFNQTAQIRQISAHSASTVRDGEKSSNSTNSKSTTRFPTNHRGTVYIVPKSPTAAAAFPVFQLPFISSLQVVVVVVVVVVERTD